MSITVQGHNYHDWEQHSLQDFGDFSDMVAYVNQSEDGFGGGKGEWFYIPDEVLPPMKDVDYGDQKPNERAIYFGTFSNSHSPGASHYTYAEIYDMDDEDDAKAFEEEKAKWEEQEEYLPSEEDDESEDEDESDEDESDE